MKIYLVGSTWSFFVIPKMRLAYILYLFPYFIFQKILSCYSPSIDGLFNQYGTRYLFIPFNEEKLHLET
jgi:hypothetical protein